MSDQEAQHIAVSDKMGSKKVLIYRRTIFKIFMVACLGIASLLYAVGIMNEAPKAPTATEQEETMFTTKQNLAVNHRIQPIDVSVPANTETATFALG